MAKAVAPAWEAVDRYLERTLAPEDDALRAALRASADAGLPSIQVSPAQGRFLHVLARSVRARRILEVGTLGGYSAIWLARALPPDGRLTSLELDPKHATVARSNLARAGLADRVEVRVGPALESLDALRSERAEPYELIFVDADKTEYPAYFDRVVPLAVPGALIVFDNVVREGAIVDPDAKDPRVRGVRELFERIASQDRVRMAVVQTVGEKGYDGFAIGVVDG